MLFSALVTLLLVSCGGGSDSNTISSTLNTGVAQKGPFLIGSAVVISELNTSGIPTGEAFESKISSKNGGFSYDLGKTVSNNYYRIQVTGHFFNENTGSTSENPIILTAITSNPEKSSINVLTHWLSQRIDVLLAKEKTLKASLEQSQNELTKLLGINNANTLDITSSSNQMAEDNAMSLLLSGALMEASQKQKVSAQTIIDEIGYDFKDDGLLNEKGDEWFIRLQALIKDNPSRHTKNYAKEISDKLGYKISSENNLPDSIPLASRPAAIVPPVLYAAPSEIVTLDGSESHDSGNIINFTWFRVDQQTQYNIQVTDRFSSSPTITAPNEATVLAAPNQEIILLYALVVTDVDKLTHTAVVKVIIRIPLPENKPPIAISQIDDQSVITNEDTPVNITLVGSDPDGDQINFVISTPLLLPNGLLEGTAPNLKYTPTANFNGTDHFTFLVDDGLITSETARVNIIVLPVNDPPIADDKTVVTDEDMPVAINFSGSDVENDPLTFRLGANSPNNGTLSGNTPNVVYAPGSNFFGNDSFDYIANDGVDDSVPATVNIIVNPVNDPPFALPQNVVTNEDTPVNITLIGSDVEGDPLSFNLGGINVQNGTLNGTPPNLTYIPDLDFNGNDSFNFTVHDGSDISTAALVNIQILPIDDNLPPTAGNLIIPFDPFKPLDIQLIGNDPDGTTLIYSIVDDPTNGALTINNATGEVEYTPGSSGGTSVPPATDSFTYQVEDALGELSNIATVNLILPPQAIATFNEQVPGTNIFNSGTSVQLVGSESFDFDGPIDTYLWEQIGSPLVALIPDEKTKNPTFIAPDVTSSTTPLPLMLTFKLTVTDKDGFTDTDEVTVAINGRPIAIPQDVTIAPNASSINITLTGTDPEGSALTYDIKSGPSDGFISGTPPNITYETYTSDQDEIIFTVTDEHGFESGPATVNIIVDNNNAPIADSRTGDLQVILNLDPSIGSGSVTFNLSGSDPDGDDFTFEIVEANPPSGTNFTQGPNFIDDGEVTYTVLDYRGAFEFKFKVRDQHDLPSADATVRIITIPFN